MREIKFRGMTVDDRPGTKIWVEGDLIQADDKCFIYLQGIDLQLTNLADKFKGVNGVYAAMPLLIEVDCRSVGQFTGLKDKNGVEIYEGDILTYNGTELHEVVYHKGAFSINKVIDGLTNDGHYYLGNIHLDMYKVVGNIYEHPHLLESR